MSHFTYRASPLAVLDGDTIYCRIWLRDPKDLGHGIHDEGLYQDRSVRIKDFDAPETRRTGRRQVSDEEKDAGEAAKVCAADLLFGKGHWEEVVHGGGWTRLEPMVTLMALDRVTLTSHKDAEARGRYVYSMRLADGKDFALRMLVAGHGKGAV